ncbi:MAG TPA: hypothetical protein VI007_11980 [bacterium]
MPAANPHVMVAAGRRAALAWISGGVLVAAVLVAVVLSRDLWLPVAVPVRDIEHVHGLAVDPRDPRILWVGTHSGLVRVVDGLEWMRVGRARYDMMGFTIVPGPSPYMVTSGHGGPTDRRPEPLGLERSRNGGRTWRTLAFAGRADFHALAVAPQNPAVLYAWSVGPRIGLYRSRTGGRQWDALGNRGLVDVYDLTVSPRDTALVFAATSRGLKMSADGGETWRMADGFSAGISVTAVAISRADPRVMYVYAMAPTIGLVRSDDRGATWVPTGLYLGKGDAVSNLALDPGRPRVLYIATYRGDVFHSSDGGVTRALWVKQGKVVGRTAESR